MRLTFETQRLAMRPFETADARRIAYLAGDYDVAKMTSRIPHPYSVQMAEQWLTLHADSRERRRDFSFAITLPRDGVIGACGLSRPEGETDPDIWEIGYWLGLPYWGLGYAAEAARGLIDWAGVELEARGFVAGHFIDNPASGAVLRKLGFAGTGRTELFGLARGCTSPVERYVWPEPAQARKVAA